MSNLNSIYIFENLSKKELEDIEKISKHQKLKKDNIIFYEGENSDFLHVLLNGVVKIYKTDNKGNEIVLHYIEGQNLIAEMAILEKIPYPATAVSQGDVEIVSIKSKEFLDLVLTNPSISLALISSLTKKIKILESTITKNLTMNAAQKMAKFIVENEKSLGYFTQKKISEILNLTPETCSRVLSSFKKDGDILVEKGKIKIVDKKALKNLYS